MLAEGKYKARAVEWSQVTAHEKTGNEEIRVALEITDGEAKGTSRTWRGYFTEGTAERTVEALRFMGWKGDDITDVQGLDANEVEIVIKHDEYEGKTQEKIAWVNRVARVYVGTPLDAAKKTAFAARMKGLVLATKPAAGASSNSPNPPRPAAANGGNGAGAGAPTDFPYGHNEKPPQRAAGGVKL